MADAVIKILQNPAEHARMSKAGPQWTAERFSRERMVNNYFRLFQSLVETPGRA
jgi:glycosyltransferase involved in cell wall biosynthesis